MQRLTPRQRDVARLIDSGMSNDEIARELGLSVSTIKTHVRDLRMQLGVTRKRHIPHVLRELGLLK